METLVANDEEHNTDQEQEQGQEQEEDGDGDGDAANREDAAVMGDEDGKASIQKEESRPTASGGAGSSATALEGNDNDDQEERGEKSTTTAMGDDEKAKPSTATTTNCDDTTTATVEDTTTLTKSQLKKRRRAELKAMKKKENKERKKQARREKAIDAGRDLEEEKRIQDINTKSGEGWKRRHNLWLERLKTADTSFRVCFDCCYENQMLPKEINSLAEQIRYCYAQNKRSPNPIYMSVASLGLQSQTRSHLNKITGFPDQWFARGAFTCSEHPLLEIHDKEKVVYLTSDSDNTLEELDDKKIYVIGGIVDRNRLKCAAITKAEELGLETAKLPITQYLQLVATKVLTCNHVFEILLKYRQHGNDWKQAMLDVLPARKDVKEIYQQQPAIVDGSAATTNSGGARRKGDKTNVDKTKQQN